MVNGVRILALPTSEQSALPLRGSIRGVRTAFTCRRLDNLPLAGRWHHGRPLAPPPPASSTTKPRP